MFLYYTVKDEPKTINSILINDLKISSRLFSKLITNQLVYVNSKICDTRNLVHIGDIVSVDLNYEEDNANIIPTQMPLNIIYEDDSFIILNKPAGIAIHPSFRYFDNTLSNGVKFYFNQINLKKKIRPVNRLDFNTSGLVIFAKNEYIQESLIKQMATNQFKKEYLAVVTGILPQKNGTIDKPISRKQGSIIERCVSPDGKKSITHFEVLEENSSYSLVKCILETGRTHQIRVHFASIGHPLLGDDLYGLHSNLINGQALCCHKLSFIHPVSNLPMCFCLDYCPFRLQDFAT